jgi:hypothetical protein
MLGSAPVLIEGAMENVICVVIASRLYAVYYHEASNGKAAGQIMIYRVFATKGQFVRMHPKVLMFRICQRLEIGRVSLNQSQSSLVRCHSLLLFRVDYKFLRS